MFLNRQYAWSVGLLNVSHLILAYLFSTLHLSVYPYGCIKVYQDAQTHVRILVLHLEPTSFNCN